MRLVLLHPEVYFRDCQHCLKYLYDANGDPVPTRNAEINEIEGEYRKRDASCPPECKLPQKGCPKGTPDAPRTLSKGNQRAYQHYRECKATGNWPDDPIVRRNAVIIGEVEQQIEEMKRRVDFEQTKQLLLISKIRTK